MRRRKFSPTERAFIIRRAHGCCEYCRTPLDFSPESFDVEHIVPLSKSGTNELENLALSCGGCNGRKSDHIIGIDPQTKTSVRPFNPRVDDWAEHFTWNDDFSKINGVTSIGNATIALLDLNRKGLVNLRKALTAFGVHPPKF